MLVLVYSVYGLFGYYYYFAFFNFIWLHVLAGATNKPQELDDAVLRRLVRTFFLFVGLNCFRPIWSGVLIMCGALDVILLCRGRVLL